MTALGALLAFFGVGFLSYAKIHVKPTHVHILCPKDGPFVFGADGKNRTTINGEAIPTGDTFSYNPPTCQFPLEPYYSGPLLFR